MATDDTNTIHVEEKGQAYSNTLTRERWAWMTNRLSDLDIPELTHTRTHTHVCNYELTSLFYSWQKYSCFHTHTPLYIEKFMNITPFLFVLFVFCLFSFVYVCLYKLCCILWNCPSNLYLREILIPPQLRANFASKKFLNLTIPNSPYWCVAYEKYKR